MTTPPKPIHRRRRADCIMKQRHNLSQLDWTLSGWIPYLWQFEQTMEIGETPSKQVEVPAQVPGSVQAALLAAGALPDWNVGLNAQQCEWVENRHWIYETALPDDWIVPGKTSRLKCLGLDYSGTLWVNKTLVSEFRGTHVPHTFDLTPHLGESANHLRIVFDLPPRWLGQFGQTSRMTEWKTRFNYTWDWMPRLVQIGIWDAITLETVGEAEITEWQCVAGADVDSGTGTLFTSGMVTVDGPSELRLTLHNDQGIIREEQIPIDAQGRFAATWHDLQTALWWPNGEGEQPLYTMECALLAPQGHMVDSLTRRIGFRDVTWRPCEDAPVEADPWVCVVNGRPVFLQGVNFPPIRPNYADLTEEDYRKRLTLYRDLGCNVFRINACGFLEKTVFYDLCDELGLLVWQEFPLTSSGLENIPPDDERSVAQMSEIARSFIQRRRHHASLILWSGGNELIGSDWRPLGITHPMLKRLQEIVQEEDNERRFVPASPSGPRFGADASEFGQGLHWDVHGPWTSASPASAADYYTADDALFRSEAGQPGTASVELIRQYAGGLNPLPIDSTNPFWRNPVSWWLEAAQFAREHEGRSPQSLEEYVAWSQERQAQILTIAVQSCKARFPRCGGVILWTGHDCFPCPTNTSIVDFHGDPKPAAAVLAAVWHAKTDKG